MKTRLTLILLLMLFSTGPLYAAEYDDAAIESCTDMRSPIKRLACFDELFATPPMPESMQPTCLFKQGIVHLIQEQEEYRPADNYDLLMNTRMEHAASQQERVILSTPALGPTGNARPVLALSCIENITRLQIILPHPLRATRTNLRIQGTQDSQLMSDQWRVMNDGCVVSAGRGIPSIRIAQQLKAHKRISLNSDQAKLDGLTFDLTKLPEHIGPLAEACHW